MIREFNTNSFADAWFASERKKLLKNFHNQYFSLIRNDILIDSKKQMAFAFREYLEKILSKFDRGKIVLFLASSRHASCLIHLPSKTSFLEATLTTNPLLKVEVWSDDLQICSEITKEFTSAWPKKEPIERSPSIIPAAFWQWDPEYGPEFSFKEIECPLFKDISNNYSSSIQKNINWLISLKDPDYYGKIIIWQGPPGTGKTYAIRALAREWHQRIGATVEVVLDPEELFGKARYMNGVFTSGGTIPPELRVAGDHNTSQPVRLIIIEDSAELFKTGCRDSSGFSRFLNLTDGLIGQGLRCVFLLTANEDIGEIDSAIKRSGRCLQQLTFDPLTAPEVKAWFKANKIASGPADMIKPMLLADLYAMALTQSSKGDIHKIMVI